jgi:hypothetical protein
MYDTRKNAEDWNGRAHGIPMGKGNGEDAAAQNFNNAIAWKRPSMILSCSSSLVVVAQSKIKYCDQVLITL